MKITGPHDHTVRDFSKKNSPIICPILLATECTYCHELGHTKNFCRKLKDKKRMSNDNYKYITASPTNKRVYDMENDDFSQISLPMHINKQSRINDIDKIQTTTRLMSAFAALDMVVDDDHTNKHYSNNEIKAILGIVGGRSQDLQSEMDEI
tara:strand:- start:65 stop:520 length:456 start_codon:yes stop_codon:yes gene_type:complete